MRIRPLKSIGASVAGASVLAVPTRPRETVPWRFRVLRMILCSDTLQDKRRSTCATASQAR